MFEKNVKVNTIGGKTQKHFSKLGLDWDQSIEFNHFPGALIETPTKYALGLLTHRKK